MVENPQDIKKIPHFHHHFPTIFLIISSFFLQELIRGFCHQLRHSRAPVALRRQRRAKDGLRCAAPREPRGGAVFCAAPQSVEQGEAGSGGATQRCPEKGSEMVKVERI
jgi:hypothetical protein